MELTKEQSIFVLQMLQQVSFQQAEAKIQAGQLQLQIEASLSASEPSQVEHQRTSLQPLPPAPQDAE